MLEAAAAPCAGDSPGDLDQSRGRLAACDALKHPRPAKSKQHSYPVASKALIGYQHNDREDRILRAATEGSSSQFQAFESMELVERLGTRTRFELATQRFAVSTSNHSVVVQPSLRLARRPIPSFRCCSCSRPVRWKSTRVPFSLRTCLHESMLQPPVRPRRLSPVQQRNERPIHTHSSLAGWLRKRRRSENL